MTPVDQDRFYEPDLPPDQQRGNCLSAVVASLLDLPLAAVPNFVQDHVDHADEAAPDDAGDWNWWTRLHRFITEQGSRMVYLRNVDSERPVAVESATFPDPESGEAYAVAGVSPRDPRIHHVVIYRDGLMVHDPHPDRTGLAIVDDEYHWTLRPADG
jgi:hypothetical protein